MQELQISTTSWHARAYFWALGVWFKFKGYDYVPDGWRCEGNLCFYIRTITVWLPLTIALHALFLGLAVLTLVKLPIALFGVKVFFWSVTYLSLAALLVWGGVRGVTSTSSFKRWVDSDAYSTAYRPKRPSVIGSKIEAAVDTGMSFLDVIIEWLTAQKQKVCPTIKFTTPDDRQEAT